MSEQLISIITPTYNSAEGLEACILSVAHQTYAHKEHLFVDNLSTDGTLEIIRKYAAKFQHIRLISEEDHGIYDAMNKGIEQSSGDWLYFMGCDDMFFDSEVLSRIFISFECSPYDVIYGNVEWGKGGTLYDGQFTPLKLLNKNICHQAIFFKRDLFERLGRFEIKYKVLADWVFNMRWFFDENITRIYLDKTIAIYNPDGFSSRNHDIVFIAERKRLVHLYFPEEYALIFDLNSKIYQKNEEYVSLKTAVDPLLTRIEEKEKDIDSLQLVIGRLEAQIDALQHTVKSIDESAIRRVTKPIRKLSNSFRKRSQELSVFFKQSNAEKIHHNSIVDKDIYCNLDAIYNKCKLQDTYSCSTLSEVTDIFIPVCNRLDFLPSLLSSIVNNTSSPFRLFLIDDGSLDKNVYQELDKYKIIYSQCDIITLQNRSTRGIVGSVKQVVRSTLNNFIILNSVTEVPPGWLERLMAPLLKSDSIITTSPFTNDDPLSGFPEFLDLYIGDQSLSIIETDELYKILTPINTYPEITKGSRFCLGVNKNAYNRIGSFTNINHKKAYRHILVPDLFIYHTKDQAYHYKNKKEYDSSGKFISGYPIEDIRKFLILNFLYNHQDQSNVILFVDHNLGGGANLYRNNYIKRELATGNHIVMLTYNFPGKSYDLCYYYNNNKLYFYSNTFEHIYNTLQRYFKFNTIILSEAVSFPSVHLLLDAIMNLKTYHNASLSILIHDYFCICPCYTLLDHHTTFCGPPSDIAKCLHCLPGNNGSFRHFYNHHNIISWRNKWLSVLNNSDNIVCFSNSSREILLTGYPDIPEEKILIRPHEIEHFKKHMTPIALSSNSHHNVNVLTIGILGNIYSEKGSGIVQEMLEIIKSEERKIRIIVIGRITPSLMSDYFIETGSYKHDELYNLVHRMNINIFFTPSICPETFSYTSEEIMLMDYPLAVFNLGAPAERAKCYHKGFIISRVDARTALDEISEHWNTTKTIYANNVQLV